MVALILLVCGPAFLYCMYRAFKTPLRLGGGFVLDVRVVEVAQRPASDKTSVIPLTSEAAD